MKFERLYPKRLSLKRLSNLTRPFLAGLAVVALVCFSNLAFAQPAAAYPAFAQAAYANPREATGRIVCANCHLAAKPTQVEVPQAVLPDSVFEAVVKIPYDTSVQQVLGSGEKGPLNVGALLMLPDGFKLAPAERIPEELKEKVGGVYVQNYSEEHPNWLVVGPLPGEQYQEITFPILSPNPNDDKAIHFGKYSVHVGGNRGRGQVYPTGDKSNNALYTSSVAGVVRDITKSEGGGYTVTLASDNGEVTETIPAGPELLISQGQAVKAGEALTSNPNVGGFGQAEAEIVLQNPNRILGLLAFFVGVSLTQIMLVLKKKQVEKVQAAEMDF
jgi:apocytochrome f